MGTLKSSHEHSFLRRGILRAKGRRRSPSPEKVDKFLRERVGSFRDAPPGETQYDADEGKFKALGDIAVEDLEKIINAHDRDPETELKVANTSWNTVFNQMNEANWRNDERTDNGSMTDGADITLAVIDMMPDEFGLGVLKGGLTIIFNAVKRHQDNRERILDTFETLPDTIVTINTAYALLEPSPEDTRLHRAFFRYRKVAAFLLLKIPESSTIDDILSRWTQQVVRLKEHVERLKINLQAKFPAKLEATKDEIKDTLKDEMESSRKEICALFAENSSMQQAIMDLLIRGTVAISEDVSRATHIFADVATIFRETIMAQRRDRELEGELRRERQNRDREREQYLREISDTRTRWDQLEQENRNLKDQVESLRRPVSESRFEPRIGRPSIKPVQLLGILGVSMNEPWDDLDYVLGQAGHFDESMRGRAQWLVETPEFKGWLQDDRSSILLVDGCMEPALLSPLSGLCCALISSLAGDDGSAVAFFFAGLHSSKVRSNSDGPTAIMRRLIAQLLLSSNLPKPDLGFLSEGMLEACHRGEILALCRGFEKLVKQVPPHMRFYSILDGISWYEQDPWLADLRYIATMFEYLAKHSNPERSGAVKVLFTYIGTINAEQKQRQAAASLLDRAIIILRFGSSSYIARYSYTHRSHTLSARKALVLCSVLSAALAENAGVLGCVNLDCPTEGYTASNECRVANSAFIDAGVALVRADSEEDTIRGLFWVQRMAEHGENGTRTFETSFLLGMPSSFGRDGTRACAALFHDVTGVDADTEHVLWDGDGMRRRTEGARKEPPPTGRRWIPVKDCGKTSSTVNAAKSRERITTAGVT
ncbi:hypothetical protein DL765_000129 [Monosporascus sp. GIB2]|nr:hypothetical protein DL765_000129 [Monosporascus sp. GIB2]